MKTIFTLMFILVCSGVISAQTGTKVTVREKKELFRLIAADDAQIKEAMSEDGDTAGALESNMTVKKRDINGDRQPEYFIEIYSGGLCGALANCPDWVYQKTGDSYKLLLRTFGRELTPEKTSTNKYIDLRSTGGDSATQDSFSIFKFNGEKYKATNCYSRVFATKGKKEKIIPIKCGEDQ
jgi:hypothetical protein